APTTSSAPTAACPAVSAVPTPPTTPPTTTRGAPPPPPGCAAWSTPTAAECCTPDGRVIPHEHRADHLRGPGAGHRGVVRRPPWHRHRLRSRQADHRRPA